MQRFALLALLLCFAFQQKIAAQSTPSPPTLFQHIAGIQDSTPLLILETDAKQLIKHKMKEEYQKAAFSYQNEQGDWVRLSAKVRARGNRRKEVCYFPPLKIELKKGELSDLGLDTLDNLKLVLQCWDNKKGSRQLYREYLIYQMHELIGPITYQTKLVRIQIGERFDEPQFGFLIEDESDFTKRLNGPVVETGMIRSKLIDREAYLRMCFFQYLILNTDWYMTNRHNLEFVMPAGQKKFCPVPYDFDYAGLVDAGYAVPHPSRNIKDVKEPCYLCEEVGLNEARRMAAFFGEQKAALYELVHSFPYLEEREKRGFIDRLDLFYAELENDRSLKRNFVNN